METIMTRRKELKRDSKPLFELVREATLQSERIADLIKEQAKQRTEAKRTKARRVRAAAAKKRRARKSTNCFRRSRKGAAFLLMG